MKAGLLRIMGKPVFDPIYNFSKITASTNVDRVFRC